MSSIFCYSQDSKRVDKNDFDFAFFPGLILQENLYFDANLLIGAINEPEEYQPYIVYSGFRVGLESSFPINNEDYTIAPKIGYEVSVMFVNLRLSAINYFQNSKSEFRILPEIGLSIGDWINLAYGYGIAFKDNNLNNLSNHRFSVNLIVY